MRICTIFIAAMLAAAGPALADGLNGQVKDSSGGALANAEVLVLTPLRAVVATARTDGSGRFDVRSLPSGKYLVIVRAESFQERQAAVEVRSEGAATIDITLDVAGLTSDVTVTAEPGTVIEQRHAAQPVNLISSDEIAIRANTVLAQAFNEEVGVNLQRTSPTMAGVFVRGLTGNKVNIFVDGVRYSNSAQRGGVNTFFDLVEYTGLEGIEVLRGPNSAEYGSDALGGSIQLLGRVPALDPDGRLGGQVGLRGSTGHRGGGGNGSVSYSRARFGLFASIDAQNVGRLRPGDGIDSHASITRYFGLASDVLYPDRLPNTEFSQWGGSVKANWTPSPSTQIVSAYMGTRQDGGDRWDQLLGGDGNLVAELNDLTLDLFYVRVERLMSGWFDHASVTYSFNTQREERVNQGGTGNPTATIGHEPERTTAHGIQGSLFKQVSPRQTLQVGGEVYFEGSSSDSFNVNPVTSAVSTRRPRVPSGASYTNGGIFARTTYDAVPDRLKLVGALRWGAVSYHASASDAPIVNGEPLWPDDELYTDAFTFRLGAVAALDDYWSLSTSFSRGYRAPHMTDLGTLGITGSGFEVSFPEISGLNAQVGSTADANAVALGPVEEMRSESSLAWDATIRYRQRRIRGEFSFFINNIHDNIQKVSLILPPGAVGTSIGGEVITQQNANGVVFVAAAANPVLVRDNFDNARIWGVEAMGEIGLNDSFTVNALYTYVKARDTETDLPPNIEGGTPAPNLYLMLRYMKPGSRWWVQPYLGIAADQPNLSTLDLGDRRTGASRSRTSIRNFFLNGATARGWISPGADGRLGTADDFLTVTGETLTQIQNRVLGTANDSPLFPEVEGYTMVGLRGGIKYGRHEFMLDLENLTDENYRGISWGMDNAGFGLNARYIVRF